jgi:hypothetical protein
MGVNKMKFQKVEDSTGEQSTTIRWENQNGVEVEVLGRNDNPYERGKSWTVSKKKDGKIIDQTDTSTKSSAMRIAKKFKGDK